MEDEGWRIEDGGVRPGVGQVAEVPCQVSRLLQQGQGEGRGGESAGY